MVNFGIKMRAMRGLKDISQEELAAKSGVNAAYISRFETGRQIATPEEESKIREVLDWTDEDDVLLCKLGEPKPDAEQPECTREVSC